MTTFQEFPSREEILKMVVTNMYSSRIVNNSHRGDIVEMMVLSALGNGWQFVGLGWHPWDIQRGSGCERVRIQVKQCAALQLWGPTQKLALNFGWSKNAPSYFKRDNPDEFIEPEGWFCDIFVFGLHLVEDQELADQVDPNQWEFLIIPICDLKKGQNSMVLSKALQKWQPVKWPTIRETVQGAILKNGKLC